MEFDIFEKELSRFDVAAVSIYTVLKGNYNCIYGEKIRNIEEYGAYTTTKIKESAVGLRDNPKYKSRLVTKFIYPDLEYIIVLSSFALHAFSKNVQDIGNALIRLGADIEKIRGC